MKAFKKYWDIFGGLIIGIGMAVLARFQLCRIQLLYSIIILVLVSIGVLRIVKQKVDENREKKRQTLIDTMIDSQQAIKAISIAQNPTKDGEAIGRETIKLWEGLKNIMKNFFAKLKTFFDKFKGIALSVSLGILTIVEGYGGYINELCGGVLEVKGVDILPLATLIASVVVGIISNSKTSEQNAKIKALFSKSSTDEVVQAEIKKTLKKTEADLKDHNKTLATKQTELDNLNSDLTSKQNTHSAKVKMASMTPKLATDEDVRLADIAVVDAKKKVAEKEKEIVELEKTIANLTSTIQALKSQL